MLAAAMVPRVEIAPNVLMPMMNFGVQNNHSMAIALGVRGLDTANVYGDSQQREVGASVRAAVDSGISRAELFVTTKIECCPGTAFGATTECVGKGDPSKNIQHNFDVLGLDYVDLLLLHWPCDDLESSLRTYAAMEPLVAAGKARAIGISNFNESAIEAFVPRVRVKPVVNQCGFSIAGHSNASWGRDDGSRAASVSHGLTFSAYSPLGGWAKGGTGHVLNDPTVRAVAAAHNTSAAAVALRWVTQQGIVAVTSSDKPSHVAGDLASFSFNLTDAEMAQLANVV